MPITTVLDPTAVTSAIPAALAPRRTSLDGLVLGLLHNTKPGGDILLRGIADRLSADYQLKGVVQRHKNLPSVPASFLRAMAEECDVVVAALAD